jgi:predicted extracellular nuclease
MIDDGSSMTHVDSSTLPFTIVTGDTLRQVIGPLAYTYSHYKIEPIVIPQIERTGMQPSTLQPAADGEFNLMSWNVENLFDALDPNPTDPPKPLPSEYRVDLEKVANTIVAAGAPTVVSLQEVENLGILEDLAEHPLLAPYFYDPVLIEGFDSRGIDVGYLVRGNQASILDVQQRDAPAGLFSRPPLLLKLEVETGARLSSFICNNHFASMSAGVEATEPQRTAQAAWNASSSGDINHEPDALVAVMGDLNSFFGSLPYRHCAGLVHVLDLLPPEQRFHIFEGESQVLDHILITQSLLDLLSRVDILHVNADFPLSAADDATPWHKSDHDPVVATFSIK